MFNFLPESAKSTPKARLKSIPEDFLVEEITNSGAVLELGKKYVFDANTKGNFLVFVLEKKDRDVFGAIRAIAKALGVPEKRFSVAGVKDKKAHTSQLASAYKLKKEQFDNLKINSIEATPLFYGSKVYLGALTANRFTITARNISLDVDSTRRHIEKKAKELDGHFPNYYGAQRFGSSRPVSHLVGKEILLGNFKKAVELYISKTGETDTEEMKKTRKNAFKDMKHALNAFPKSCNYERNMISHLIENPKDFKGALRKLPAGLVKMFVSAFQSYIFNRALVELMQKNRAKKDTTIPVPGYLFSSRIFSNEQDECVEKLLVHEKISPSMFKIKEMPEISSKGEKRQAFAQFHDFKLINVSKDNQNKGKTKATLRFTLDKGCYATVFLRNFFDEV